MAAEPGPPAAPAAPDARVPVIETFNTHRMSDAVVLALATGRQDELDTLLPAIRDAATRPQQPPPALIVYGERGSGKSFLMRLVQLACQPMPGVACALLPEELYNVRAPHQLLQMVAAAVRGEDWAGAGWRLDNRAPEQAWAEELAALHAALDARFGPGRGLAVALVENFDQLTEKLFGAQPAAAATNTAPARRRGPARAAARPPSAQALARRQDEERLRHLLSAPGGRLMLVATATGTVDMDYERPLFLAFTPIDLRSWGPDTAIGYFNKRRQLAGQPPLGAAEQARARAIIDFIGGNPRLAQLLGTVLAQPSAQTIADTLDELADKLADYYRDRLGALPPAAAALLDELIRGGEPVTQSGLAQRMGGQQSSIADAFSHLSRGRLVVAAAGQGGAQWYRVRDRLFVHFYRRRYGSSRGLAPIAELLERFYTPLEREQQIRAHLARGEFDDARAFGALPLRRGAARPGYCLFRDAGVLDPPPHRLLALAGVPATEQEAQRLALRDRPEQAFRHWADQARQAPAGVPGVAAGALAAVAASRMGHDQIAQAEIEQTLAGARAGEDPDALVQALGLAALFNWYRAGDRARANQLYTDAAALLPGAKTAEGRRSALYAAAFQAIRQERHAQAAAQLGEALALTQGLGDSERLRLLRALAWAQAHGDAVAARQTYEQIEALATAQGGRYERADAQCGLARLHASAGRTEQAEALARDAMALFQQVQAHDDMATAAQVLAGLLAATHRLADARQVLQDAAAAAAAAGDADTELDTLAHAAWLLSSHNQHEQALAQADAALTRAQALGLPAQQAQALYHRAWSEWQLGRTDHALASADQGLVQASLASPVAAMAASWCERLLALMHQQASQPALAAQHAAAAWQHALASQELETQADALHTWVDIAAVYPQPAAVQALAEHLRRRPADWDSSGWRQGRMVLAAAQVGAWGVLAEAGAYAVLGRPARPGGGLSFGLAESGRAWARQAAAGGRAEAFALLARALPHLPALAAALAPGQPAATALDEALHRLVSGLVDTSREAAFLRDVAELAETQFGAAAAEPVQLLRGFADFHAAADPEAHLRRADPDLAVAIRRLWLDGRRG